MARALRAALRGEPRIVASPLVRAQQTAAILAEELTSGVCFETDERLGGGARFGDLQAICAARSGGSVILVGHEPDCSRLVGVLTGGTVKMKTSGAACIEAIAVEPGAGALQWLVNPDVT